MVDLSCKYLGLDLNSPFIVGGKGVSHTVSNNIEIESQGASGILLPPITEEGLLFNSDISWENTGLGFSFPEYCNLIKDTTKSIKIPVIASINCYSADNNWFEKLKSFQDAGASALEIVIEQFPFDKDFRSEDYEKSYLDIATRVACSVQIPVSIRIHPYFTNIVNMADMLFYRGITGIVLLNKQFYPDIDLNELDIVPSSADCMNFNYINTLKFTAILSSQLSKIDLAAYDIFDIQQVVKLVLAGTNVTILNSVVKENGFSIIEKMKSGVSKWLEDNGFECLDNIHKQTNYQIITNPFEYERQYLLAKS